jgi:hypothetical protein
MFQSWDLHVLDDVHPRRFPEPPCPSILFVCLCECGGVTAQGRCTARSELSRSGLCMAQEMAPAWASHCRSSSGAGSSPTQLCPDQRTAEERGIAVGHPQALRGRGQKRQALHRLLAPPTSPLTPKSPCNSTPTCPSLSMMQPLKPPISRCRLERRRWRRVEPLVRRKPPRVLPRQVCMQSSRRACSPREGRRPVRLSIATTAP